MTIAVRLLLSLSAAARACPFCFARTPENAKFIDGLTIAVFSLILITLAILLTLARAVRRMERRNTRADTQ